MKRSLVVAVLASVLLSAPVSSRAQDRFVEQVREALMWDAMAMLEVGYDMVDDVYTGRANDGETSTMEVWLEAGRVYAILAACDEDCSDVDLRLFDGNGEIVDEDLEMDDYPQVGVNVSNSGNFRVDVIMAACSSGPCRWGFAVFVATDEAAALEEFAEESGSAPHYYGTPSYGSVELASGFSPDPFERSIPAGGDDPVGLTGAGCSGHINADAPDFNLTFTAGAMPLNLYARSDTDVTLIVNTPSGEWVCSDDVNGTNPHIRFDAPVSGVYNIWIGTFSAVAGKPPASTLYISELDPRW